MIFEYTALKVSGMTFEEKKPECDDIPELVENGTWEHT